MPASRPILIARLTILLAVLIVFAPVLGHDFGGWDDAMNLQHNPDFNPPSLHGIAHYWRAPAFDLYAPVTFTVWGIISWIAYHPPTTDSAGYLSPLPFHAANLLLHAMTGLAVFELLRRIISADPADRTSLFACAVGALFFAIHPLQVEPVAWVSGLKDVLGGLLAMLSLMCIVRRSPLPSPPLPRGSGGGERTRVRLSLACVLMVLAVLAKPSALVVPPIALVLDWAVRRDGFKTALRSLPLFIVAIPLALVARHAQPALQIWNLPIKDRRLVAGDALAFYLWKLVWPLRLGIDYGRTPPIVIGAGWSRLTWLAPVMLAAGAALAAKRGATWLAVALAVFVIGLAPVLGLVSFDFQAYSTVADHYVYIAMLGPAIAVAAMLARTRSIGWRVGAVLLCGTLAILCFRQSLTWRDARTISQQTLRANPASFAAHAQLARIELDRDAPAEAVVHARRAVELNPHYAAARVTLAQAYARLGRFSDAEAAYREALAIAPRDLQLHVELANLLADQKRPGEAIEQYLAALAIAPRDVITLTNLAGVYAEQRDFDRALRCYDAALSADPNFPPARAGRQRAVQERATHSRQ